MDKYLYVQYASCAQIRIDSASAWSQQMWYIA